MPKPTYNPRRGGILKVLLLIALVAIAAVTMAVFIVARTIHVKEAGNNNVSIETPGGTFNIQGHKQRLDPESVGVPVYPNATINDKNNAGGASFQWDSKKDGESSSFSIVGAEYVTDDSPEKVRDFYRTKLGTWVLVTKSISGETSFETVSGKWKRIVSIRDRDGRTYIGIASIGEPARN